ncbi:MAG: ClpP-like prohead protease/major capsid protein fusion protein [Sinimarinibacterium flocculans]|uniref:ClpP-like prohead protease/major capsid protein fusion protein n=1 Tax=Sinimarinibacterium flocculans TaxID=985250 RepID=UPI003C509408
MPAPKKRKPAGAIRARGDWWTISAANDDSAEVLIYGDIGHNWWDDSGVTAQNLVNELRDIEASTIVVRINSYGGVVAEGLAIYNALRRHPAEIVVSIDGVAVSIASLIAMAGDRVEIAPNARFMVHAPWGGCMGNAVDMREMADVLDGYADSMAASYERKTGKAHDEILALLSDGQDHWYGAQQAVDFGFADEIVGEDEGEPETESRLKAAARRFGAKFSALRTAPELAIPTLAAWRPRGDVSPAKPPAPQNPAQPAAAAAHNEVTPMNWKLFAAALGITVAADADDAAARAAVCAHFSLPATASDDEISAAAATRTADAAVAEARIRAAETLRRTHISNAFMAFRSRPELAQMERECLDDMSVSAQAARDRLLAKLGEGAEPLNSGVRHVNVGEDARDKRVAAASAAILVRCGLQQDPETKKPVAFDGANPFRGATLSELVTDVLAASNVDVRAYDREERAALALGGRVKGMQTTSDFPVILENTLHKLMLTGFQAITPVYVRFCKIGDVSDLRDWNRLVPGLMGSLEVVNEHGEYKNKNIPDAEKEAIRAKRRGNILSITPEVIINDDIGYVADMARGVGMIGGRSVDRTVFELLAQNSGNGPVLKKTGNTLFHADHGNLADSGAAPSVATLAAAADAMAQQKAPGEDQEFLDISPAVALSSHSLAREIQVLVGSEYDPDASNKLQRPNKVRGLVGDVVGTPRFSGNAWELFADPNIAPVIEVVFLNGQRVPRLVEQEAFRTGGLEWRVEFPYGAGAIDYRGAYRNPGAGG